MCCLARQQKHPSNRGMTGTLHRTQHLQGQESHTNQQPTRHQPQRQLYRPQLRTQHCSRTHSIISRCHHSPCKGLRFVPCQHKCKIKGSRSSSYKRTCKGSHSYRKLAQRLLPVAAGCKGKQTGRSPPAAAGAATTTRVSRHDKQQRPKRAPQPSGSSHTHRRRACLRERRW